MRSPTRRAARAAALVTAVGLIVSAPLTADAHRRPVPTPDPVVRSDQLGAPFNLDLSTRDVYFADGGLNVVGTLGTGGATVPVATDQPGASGVAISRDGRYLAFTTTVSDESTFENTASGLNIWGPRGSRVYADTHAFEVANNPDATITYGVQNASQCVQDAFQGAGLGPASYPGLPDSHSYSVAAYRGGWVVADAGANTLWKVTDAGVVSTLAVLPAQPAVITADVAASLGLPDCAVGVTYGFESVPTDVEVGDDGALYVTTLPGGPESDALGARGALWRLDPRSGRLTELAGGLAGATNLAIGDRGEIYVAELFAGRISVVRHGRVTPYLSLPGVVAVETDTRGRLWAATMGSEAGPGTIVQVTQGRAHWRATVSPHTLARAAGR